ncbi:hypothetical protein R6Z07F_007160 [Ovis aries]
MPRGLKRHYLVATVRQKERRRRRGRPGLSGAGFGGKLSFLYSFSSCRSFPPPPNSATPDPLRSSPSPSAVNAVSAPADDSGLAGGAGARPQQSRGAGPRLRPRAELSEVCHFERGYGVARKRCRSVSAARRTGQPDTPSGEASGSGGQGRGSAHTYSWPTGSRVPPVPHPRIVWAAQSAPAERARTQSEVAKQNPPSPAPRPSPHPLLRVCEAATAAEGGAACQVQPPSLPSS